jgi:putative efflux protein, MATE family
MKEQSVNEQTYERMVNSPLRQLIIILAVPSIISILVTNVYNMADTYFVGQLGTSATAGVGIVYPLMTLIYAIGLTFGKGTGTWIARLLGNRDICKAEEVAVLGLYTVFGVGTVLTVLGLIFLKPLTFLLGSTESMAPYAMEYIRYILIAMPFAAAQVTLSSMLRFQGFFYSSMVGLGCGALLNVGLDPIFIFVLGWGVKGAGIATMLSQIFSFYVLLAQFRRKGSIRINRKNFHLSYMNLSVILRGGFPSFVKNGLSSFANVLLNMAAGVYGDAAVAAISIVARFIYMCQQIFFGVGESCQSVSSFNYGAKRNDRVLKSFWFCIRLGLCMMLALSVVSWLGAADIIAVFRRDDAEVICIGTTALRLQLLMLPLIPVSSTAFVMLQGIGKNTKAMLVGVGRQGLFLVPILLVLQHYFGITGLLAAQPCSDLLAFLLAIILVKPVLKELKKEHVIQ